MAPCTVLQEKPGMVLRVEATSEALRARLARFPCNTVQYIAIQCNAVAVTEVK
jgi:hypothetical protein